MDGCASVRDRERKGIHRATVRGTETCLRKRRVGALEDALDELVHVTPIERVAQRQQLIQNAAERPHIGLIPASPTDL